MNKLIDDLGRVVIPAPMRKQLEIKKGDPVNIECKDNKVIISNFKEIRSREEINKFLEQIQSYDDDISKGMKAALEWVLKEDTK